MPPKPPVASWQAVDAQALRITMLPADAVTRRRPRAAWWEGAPWVLGLASAVLLLLATVAWPWWFAVAGRWVAPLSGP